MKKKKQKDSAVTLSRGELCIIQQALQLRKFTIINSSSFDEIVFDRIRETNTLITKIQSEIFKVDGK